MKIGNILFPYNGDPARDHALIAELLREAQLSEDLGVDAIWLAEHHFSGICPYADPFGLASAIAATTKRIKIGFSVLQASFHHPVKLAEQIAFLDNLSQGRAIIGLGRGNMAALYEYDAYNVSEVETQDRLIETEELLVNLLSGGSSHNGEHWSFKIPSLRPKPVSKPHPPILRSVVKEASFVEMGRQNRAFLAGFISEAELKRRLGIYEETMREEQRTESEIRRNLSDSWTWRRAFVGETNEEAERIGLPAYRAMRLDRRTESERLHLAVGRNMKPSQQQEDAFICGSPERVAEILEESAATGIGGMILQFRLGAMPPETAERSLRLFMKQVAPRLRDAGEQTQIDLLAAP